jgi:hypothetical protein
MDAPMRPTPPTLAHEPPDPEAGETLGYEARRPFIPDRPSAPISVPPALSQVPLPQTPLRSSGLVSSDPALRPPNTFGGTKFGVPPPPIRTSKPHPVSAARRRAHPALLISVLLLVVGGTITLVIVLMT